MRRSERPERRELGHEVREQVPPVGPQGRGKGLRLASERRGVTGRFCVERDEIAQRLRHEGQCRDLGRQQQPLGVRPGGIGLRAWKGPGGSSKGE